MITEPINVKYKRDDVIKINDGKWIIDDIRMKWGREWVYELTSSIDKSNVVSVPIDTLEKMLDE